MIKPFALATVLALGVSSPALARDATQTFLISPNFPLTAPLPGNFTPAARAGSTYP